MGKKGKWFGAVKRVFSPESKEKKEEVTLLPLKDLWYGSRLDLINAWVFLHRIAKKVHFCFASK
jgi:hypothetical protein